MGKLFQKSQSYFGFLTDVRSYEIIDMNVKNECNSIHVGKVSSKQIVRLFAESTNSTVTSGSYRMSLNDELTECIPYDATALFVKSQLLLLSGVFDAIVIAKAQYGYSGFPSEYDITIRGAFPNDEASTLSIPKIYFGRSGCQPFVGGINHRASVIPIYESRTCANGADEMQLLLAEGDSQLGGTFDLHYADNNAKSVPVTCSNEQMRDYLVSLGIPSQVKVFKLFHDENPFSKAWAISGNLSKDTLSVVDRLTTGKNVQVKVYPMVRISTYSFLDDISGHFRIHLGGEVTGLISHDATHGKLKEELNKLSCVGQVAILGDGMGSSFEVNMLVDETLKFSSKKALSGVGDLSHSFSSGDFLFMGSCKFVIGKIEYFEFSSSSDVGFIHESKYGASEDFSLIQEKGFTLIQVYFGEDQWRNISFANDCGVPESVSTLVKIGSVVKSRLPLPGHISIIPSFLVKKATKGSMHINVDNANGILDGDRFSVEGIVYQAVQTTSDCGEGCLQLSSMYVGTTILDGEASVNAYRLSDLTMMSTRDLSQRLSISDQIFIEEDTFTVLSIGSGKLQLTGIVTKEHVGVDAFTLGHGSVYSIAFKSYSADLATFEVRPESNWSGSGTSIEIARPFGYHSGYYEIGNPSEIQVMTFKDPNPDEEYSFKISFDNSDTSEISWPKENGQAACKEIENSINSIAPLNLKVKVDLFDYELDSTRYLYKITFYGTYPNYSVPKLTSKILRGSTRSEIVHGIIRYGLPNFSFSSSYTSFASNQSYLLRISAKNGKGYGSLSRPIFVDIPSFGVVPSSPRSVMMGRYYNETDISLSFIPPLHDGGEKITRYRIEWDTSADFSSLSPHYGIDEIQIVPEEQDIILYCKNSCYGGFVLSWGENVSNLLPVDATSTEVELEINRITGLLALGSKSVKVTKKSHGFGNIWSVTFIGVLGNIGNIAIDDRFIYGGSSFMKTTEIIPGNSDIYPGAFTNEVQTFYIQKEEGYYSGVAGLFTLEFEESQSKPLSVNATALDVKMALESLDTIHSVNVEKREYDSGLNAWVVTFNHLVHGNDQGSGDVQMLKISSTWSEPSVAKIRVFESIKGTKPRRYFIKNCTQGLTYYARVYARNSIGYGISSEISSAMPRGQPDPPLRIISYIPSDSGNSLVVEWDNASNNGGSAIIGYKIEWFSNVNNSFRNEIQKVTTSATDGIPEIQLVRTSSDTNSLSGYFTLTFGNEVSEMISHDAPATGANSLQERLQRLSSVGNIEVSRSFSKALIQNEEFRINYDEVVLSSNGSNDLSNIFSVGDLIYIGTDWHIIGNVTETSVSIKTRYQGPSAEGIKVYKWAFGYEWAVTFKGHVGDQPQLVATPEFNWSG